MSLLKSYSYGQFYGYSELPTEVLNLFLDLVKDPNKKVEFATEIISAGLRGNIDFTRNFNLSAYEYTIRATERMNKEKKKQKEMFIADSYDDDSMEMLAKMGGISPDLLATKVVKKMQDAYEELIDDDELKYAIATIRSLQPVMFVDEHVNLLKVIEQAIKGVPESIARLKKLCDDYTVVAEQIKIILSSGHSYEEMFASP